MVIRWLGRRRIPGAAAGEVERLYKQICRCVNGKHARANAVEHADRSEDVSVSQLAADFIGKSSM
jgi:hypothetical protein